MKSVRYETVKIDKLVHGGQGLGSLIDGRKVFVWNALPGETVKARLTKSKKDYAEGVAEEIIEPSSHRIEPREENFLATSPWQIINFEYENNLKSEILKETFKREGIETGDIPMLTDGQEYSYRNKIEFSFYGDDDGIHYAFYSRGTHSKHIVNGSLLAMYAINRAAKELLIEINDAGIRAGDMKSVIFRCSQDGSVAGALFVKPEKFDYDIGLPGNLKGLKIYYSNPKSPASVPTKLIKQIGECDLRDELGGHDLSYSVDGFFQVNLPVFKLALESIQNTVSGQKGIVDMYSGVGSIGLSVKGTEVLVELDKNNAQQAAKNAEKLGIKVVHSSSEQALEYVTSGSCIIVDPPRSGLHKDLVNRILEANPKLVCYLSCNPVTQARDIGLLNGAYEIKSLEGYNFFPHTPHIESLAILGVR